MQIISETKEINHRSKFTSHTCVTCITLFHYYKISKTWNNHVPGNTIIFNQDMLVLIIKTVCLPPGGCRAKPSRCKRINRQWRQCGSFQNIKIVVDGRMKCVGHCVSMVSRLVRYDPVIAKVTQCSKLTIISGHQVVIFQSKHCNQSTDWVTECNGMHILLSGALLSVGNAL